MNKISVVGLGKGRVSGSRDRSPTYQVARFAK